MKTHAYMFKINIMTTQFAAAVTHLLLATPRWWDAPPAETVAVLTGRRSRLSSHFFHSYCQLRMVLSGQTTRHDVN